ncbi:hypothetical protein GZ77_07345 [Endozoicomonas montiporae]|uniref:Uncharacterized protein n=2 Tax=Endozoicomonas montiporae TaxID=1027273 RepID=A0A081N706_9GAMM|nr:hypothetical protein [Endozoicomonas montiporae]AMO55961.1 hypothetical protein EZMO1_1818 [Endozoicomonas montiporae CL-33]KEQ14229.1 hypothetical protein GZ77_07345 [Endozoicomonas montiporae]
MSHQPLQLHPVEEHKRDCLARYYLDNLSRTEVASWLESQTNACYREDMRQRLNTQVRRLKECRTELETSQSITWVWLTEQWTLRELQHCMEAARLDAHAQAVLRGLIDKRESQVRTR